MFDKQAHTYSQSPPHKNTSKQTYKDGLLQTSTQSSEHQFTDTQETNSAFFLPKKKSGKEWHIGELEGGAHH